jgi:plasmid maintenance system antidote protein VapI
MRYAVESFSVPELRKMLGIGKTDSYWILKHRNLKIVTVNGQIRILKSSFHEWYKNQIKYSMVNGPPPGEALKAMSYSVGELKELLAVSEDTIHTLIAKGAIETFTVDYCTRITKESFERWYYGQDKFRTPADQAQDEEIRAVTYSLPDIGRLLCVHRNTVYGIINNGKNQAVFEFVTVAGQKRVTIASFECWYNSQKKYRIYQKTEDETISLVAAKGISEPQPEAKKEPVPDEKKKTIYTVDDLQAALGISRKAAYNLIQSGEVLAVKAGKYYLIPAVEFQKITGRSQDNGDNHSEE